MVWNQWKYSSDLKILEFTIFSQKILLFADSLVYHENMPDTFWITFLNSGHSAVALTSDKNDQWELMVLLSNL